MRPDPRRYALAAATAFGIVALVIAIAAPQTQQSVATATPSPATPIADAPRVIFTRQVVLGGVPGGGLVTGPTYDAFMILSAGRPPESHAVFGGGVGTPMFDGRDRIAYWRSTGFTSGSGMSGPYEVVVWDLRADRERVLLTLKDERSNGELLWSADRKSLVVPTRAVAATGGGAQTRLLLIDADNGTMRLLHAAAADAAIRPLFSDGQVVVGVRGNSYVVLDTTSGAVRTQTPVRVPGTFLVQSAEFAIGPDGNVVELHRRFETEAGPLWIWNVHDPGTDIARVDQRGIYYPIFWPGRTEVVFSAATGLMALDYRSGVTRPLVSPSGVHRILTVESSGRFALAQTASGLEILDRTGDRLDARPDLVLGTTSLLIPIGLFLP